LRLTLLTMVRTIEAIGAQWDEFDLDAKLWRIPAERMKMKAPHVVPLSRQVLALLEELRPLTGRYALLFPGREPSKPISNNTMLFAMYRMGYHGKATVHGFRATASTILNESGFHGDAIERQLAHKEQNETRAAYHRAEYVEERTRMMQWWADFIDQQAGANVIPMKPGKAA
jgi:integrase